MISLSVLLFSLFYQGGIYQLVQDIVSWLIGFFVSIGYAFVNGILAIASPLNNVIPDPTNLLSDITSFFNLASTYIGYIIDMSFISSAVLAYFVSSLIFRIVARRNTFLIKSIVNWYNKLKK